MSVTAVERSACASPGCSNVVELNRHGNERQFCRRHRGGRELGTPEELEEPASAAPAALTTPTTPTMKPAQGSVQGAARKSIGEVINDTVTPERVQELLDAVLDTKSTRWGFCPNCRKKVSVEVPDPAKAVGVLKDLLEQAEGKPKDGDSAGTTIVVERPAR